MPDNSALGGGLKNLNIYKGTNYHGGSAIYVLARNDAHRPTEFNFENVLISGDHNDHAWDHAIHLDGRKCGTAGGIGIRNFRLEKFRGSSGRIPNENILIEQVSHFQATAVALESAGNGAEAGITVKYGCSDINIHAAEVGGNFIFDETTGNIQNYTGSGTNLRSCPVTIAGTYLVSFQVNSNLVTGVATVQSARINCASSSMKILCGSATERAKVSVSGNGDLANVTGECCRFLRRISVQLLRRKTLPSLCFLDGFENDTRGQRRDPRQKKKKGADETLECAWLDTAFFLCCGPPCCRRALPLGKLGHQKERKRCQATRTRTPKFRPALESFSFLFLSRIAPLPTCVSLSKALSILGPVSFCSADCAAN